MQSAYSSLSGSQETLVTLASDTGGKSFSRQQRFQARVHQDARRYSHVLRPLLSQHQLAKDGRYRRITVSIPKRPDLKLDFRHGYYAAADFQHSTKVDREQQLQDQLASNLPSTDLPVFLSSDISACPNCATLCRCRSLYLLPQSHSPKPEIRIAPRWMLPGSFAIKASAFYTIRDTVKFEANTSSEVKRKNVQYDAGYLLASGRIPFEVRDA